LESLKVSFCVWRETNYIVSGGTGILSPGQKIRVEVQLQGYHCGAEGSNWNVNTEENTNYNSLHLWWYASLSIVFCG